MAIDLGVHDDVRSSLDRPLTYADLTRDRTRFDLSANGLRVHGYAISWDANGPRVVPPAAAPAIGGDAMPPTNLFVADRSSLLPRM